MIDIIYTYKLNELRQSQTQLDQNSIRIIANGPDKSVIITQQIVVQPFRVRIAEGKVYKEELQKNKYHPLKFHDCYPITLVTVCQFYTTFTWFLRFSHFFDCPVVVWAVATADAWWMWRKVLAEPAEPEGSASLSCVDALKINSSAQAMVFREMRLSWTFQI